MAAEPHRALERPRGKLTLLAPTTLLQDDLDAATAAGFRAALASFEAQGHEVREAPLPLLTEVDALYGRYGSFSSHEAWAQYEEEFTAREADFDPRVLGRVKEFGNRPSADYIRLCYARADLRCRFWPELAGVDAIVAPTIPQLPPLIADLAEDASYFAANRLILRNTAAFNILASPAASVPVWRQAGEFPVSCMIVTRPGEEELALGIAQLLETRSSAPSRAVAGA